MLDAVSKSKKSQPEQPLPKGRSAVYNLRLGHDRDAAITAFIAAQKVPPDKAAVILAAVDKFLTEEGYWPPKERDE